MRFEILLRIHWLMARLNCEKLPGMGFEIFLRIDCFMV